MAGNHHPVKILAIALVIFASGCDNRDERLTQLAEMQSRQNEDMSTLHREVASGSRQLIEAQAASTDKLLAMQGELQQQHTQLELERRMIAGQRQRESLLVPLVSGLGAILLALLPLFVCARLLRQIRDEPAETELSSLLLEEFLAAEPSRHALPPGPAEPMALPTPPDSRSDCPEDEV